MSAQSKRYFFCKGISANSGSPFFVFIISFLLFSFSLFASFDFNSNCQNAYRKIFNLQFNSAREIIEKEKDNAPGNAAISLLENNIDFLSAYITEEEFYYNRLQANRDKRLRVLDRGNNQSPFCLYSQADVYIQCGFVKLKFGDYASGALDFLKANSLLKKNQRLFPKFILNLKGLGMMHAMAGVVPSEYKWLSSIAGFEGTVEQGLGELDSLLQLMNAREYDFIKPEVALMLFYLKRNFDNVHGEEIITQLFSDSTLLQNPLVAFGYSGFLMKVGKAEEAINILERADKAEDIQLLLLEFRLGSAKLCRGDKDAISHLLKFASSFKGRNYLRSGFRLIAWYYLLNNDEKKYRQFIADVLLTGSGVMDEDKEATREAKEKRVPDKKLLRARLFYDGGFFSNAQNELKKINLALLRDKTDSVEFDYRSARTFHALTDTTRAMTLYAKTFLEGKNLRYHYAANSALQLGIIYEEKKDKAKAKEWFEKCLWLPPHDYRASIEQKAKAGLERIK